MALSPNDPISVSENIQNTVITYPLHITVAGNSNTENFTYSGSVQSWTVPQFVYSVQVTLIGAGGRTPAGADSTNGKGGKVVTTVQVTPGETYYFNIGSSGGYNGGGGGSGICGIAHDGGPGGGMSWFSTQNTFTQATVIAVAGGGGGDGGAGAGGDGGGLTAGGGGGGGDARNGQGGGGGDQNNAGGGGAASSKGGTPGTAGSAGQGGNGGTSFCAGNSTDGSGGGGGGYYGGGGGGGGGYDAGPGSGGGGGGGGSSFTSYRGSNTTHTADFQVGNGSLSITYSYSYFSESISVSESVPTPTVKLPVSVSQAVTVTENVSMVVVNYGTDDFSSTATTATYKWLTSTLKTAQQQPALRPYMKCYVQDDSVSFNQAFSNPNQPLNGDVAKAPDGRLFAAGRDASGNLGVWIITDASQASQWTAPPAFTLLLAANWQNNRNVSIAISEYVNGTYVIDVYCWISLAGFLNVDVFRSSNGGKSFSPGASIGSSSISDATTDNVYLAAGKPVLTTSNTVSGIVFWIDNIGVNQYQVIYSYYSGSGPVYGAGISWSSSTIDSNDWMLHSLDSYYENETGFYYIVFSGYHTSLESTNGMYSVYWTSLQKITNVSTTDVWSYEHEIIASLSSSTYNLNNFTLPKADYDGSLLWLVFRGDTTDSVDENGVATSHTNYFSMKSKNLRDYSYPTPFVSSDGVEFDDTNAYSFVKQGSYYYLAGSGKLWQYTANNVVADVTDYVINYQISEIANSPSAIALTIGNQNGQWVGPTPTLTGASAIAKNKKILLYQGYYNALGVPETVPRNVYYIDDIEQNISNTRNDLGIQGRDWYKKLKTQVTRFPFSYRGPDFFLDTFTDNFPTNWNQKYGTWVNSGGYFTPSATPNTATEYVATVSGINLTQPSMILSTFCELPNPTTTDQYLYIYPFWKNDTNWLRLSIVGNGSSYTWAVEKNINGFITTLDTGPKDFAYNSSIGQIYLNIHIKRYGYGNFSFFSRRLGSNSTDPVDGYQTVSSPQVYIFKNSTGGQFNTSGISGYDITTAAVGCKNFVAAFKTFKLIQYNNSLSIGELFKSLGAKAEIYDYELQTDFQDYLYAPTDWSGIYRTFNRILTIPAAGNFALKTSSQLSNFEIEFDAKIDDAGSSNYSFDFIFRNQSTTSLAQGYSFRMLRKDGITSAKFVSKNTYTGSNAGSSASPVFLMDTSYDDTSTVLFNSTNLDITKWHRYKVVVNNSLMAAFVDGTMVLGWFDTNENAYYSEGYIGFTTTTGGTLSVKNIAGTTFWPQINAFSLNPGDDFDSAVRSIADIVKSFAFSDLFGRFKAVVLKDTDISNYAYNTQLWMQQVDNSDKEYVNQVTVVGQGVSAIARDNESIGSNAITRDAVIVDYKIKSLTDAQSRADFELINFNKFNASSNPKQVMNVGGELFDVVHITNTGNNSSDVDEDVRVYSQRLMLNSGTGEDSIELGTGRKT